MSRLRLNSWEVARRCLPGQRISARDGDTCVCWCAEDCMRETGMGYTAPHVSPPPVLPSRQGYTQTNAGENCHRVGRPVTLCWRLERAAHGLMPTESPVVRYEAHSQVWPDLPHVMLLIVAMTAEPFLSHVGVLLFEHMPVGHMGR